MRTYLRLLGYLRPYRARLVGAIVFMVIYAITTTASLGLVSPFMRVLFERPGAGAPAPPPASAPPAAAHATDPFRWPSFLRQAMDRAIVQARPLVALERICLFLLMVLFLKNLADYLQSAWMMRVEQAAIRDLRNDLQAHLQRLSLSFFHASRTGVVISRVTNDVEYLRNALASGVSTFVKDALTLVGAIALAFFASWRLTLLALLILPAASFGLQVVGRKMRRRSARAQERMGDLTAMLQETTAGARVVRAFGAEAYERERFARVNQAFYEAFVRMRRVALLARPMSEFGLVLVALAMLYFGGREVLEGRLPAPQFMLFVTALLTTISPTKSLAEVSANLHQ